MNSKWQEIWSLEDFPFKEPDGKTTHDVLMDDIKKSMDREIEELYAIKKANKKQYEAAMSKPTFPPIPTSFTELDVGRIMSLKKMVSDYRMKVLIQTLNMDSFFPRNTYAIAGGALSSLLAGFPCNDIDVFVFGEKVLPVQFKKYRKHLGSLVRDVGTEEEDVNNDGYKRTGHVLSTFRTCRIPYTGHPPHNFYETPVNFIYTLKKNLEDLLVGFDYAHCTVGMILDLLLISPASLFATDNRYLIPNEGVQIDSYRTDKFLSRGYTLYETSPV